ncbi:hypothetical protein [Phenylobacterium sp. SCN 70-31]|mgnify:CR=1 FL=1|uniref:hypothetical protein n=1 Tax=Phenylobacterium sp. SCN 70-31 TaxID=1660129 RepID=UPI0008692ADE|nr:hypothetical protein [Phenylobacterium sp. SCN 70-31]ODT85840.1 MAG: hypothetical protein ABS78_18660 [Phenylobacterium sp. SCN 70-31]
MIAWLDAQDAVFATCQEEVALPPLPAGAPAWLKADRAYQAAAHALYAGRTTEAAAGFGAISLDDGSPWRGMGPYLKARALRRAALAEPSPERFTLARVAIADLSRRPAGTFGRDEVRPMLRSLDFRDRPRDLMAELSGELAAPAAPADLAVVFRDAVSLARLGQPPPEPLDWIATLRPEADAAAGQAANWEPQAMARLRREARLASQAHAVRRWRAGGSSAWLVAALALGEPGDGTAAALVVAARAVDGGDPAWLTVQYHLGRLTLATDPPATSRARLDAILARRDLSTSDRNLFAAQRAQVAADLGDFARFALRRRICPVAAYVDGVASPDNGCKREVWLPAHVADSGVYDGVGETGTVGFGEDARAIIDRMPLAQRIALSRHPAVPGQLRLDLAITSYARAVLLQDHAAVDGLAADLAKLLPQLAPEWRRIRETPVGPAKRFAEFFVLAKVPGVRTDLVDYTRPEGTVAQFQYYWIPWVLVSRPVMPAPPPLALYQADGSGVEADDPDSVTDLTCLGECGVAATPLRLPDFVVDGQRQALDERSRFVRREAAGWAEPPPPMPAGGVSVWDEMLAFARANPTHPQVPEALYWINRAGRWGGSHAQSGKRAFQLLHARYPKSTWAKRSPYYYD